MSTVAAPESQAVVQQALKKVTALATLPEVTAKIVTTVENPNSSAAQLHSIISHDPALVTRILKVVNSAFYGLPGQIASVERAIVMLGLNAVKNIAVAASLGQMFRGLRLCSGFTAKDLWTHCIAVAVASRDMARQMKLSIVEEAFLAGMIHDMGVLITLQVWPQKVGEVCEQAKLGGDYISIEKDILGVDHQQLGQALAEQWKFPRACQLVAGYHHRPTALSEDNRLLITLVYAADTICCQGNQGFNLTGLHQKLEDAGLADMKIDPALIQTTAANLDQLVSVVGSLFGNAA